MKKKAFVHLIIGTLWVFLAVVLLQLFNQYILTSLPLGARMVLMIVCYWLVALVPLLLTIRNKAFEFQKEQIGLQILVGLGIGTAMSVGLTLIPTLFGFGDWVDNGHHYTMLWQFVYDFVYYIIAVALVEEFVFRGFLFDKIKILVGSEWIAIILSSLLFGLFHFAGGNIAQIILTGLMGAFFCLCRRKLRNCTLLSLIIAHGVYDALITVWASFL